MAEPIIHIIDNDSEADTCRKFVLSKLKDESSWTDDQILEHRPFTAGKIIVIGQSWKKKESEEGRLSTSLLTKLFDCRPLSYCYGYLQ